VPVTAPFADGRRPASATRPSYRAVEDLAAAFGLDGDGSRALEQYVELLLGWPGNVTGLATQEEIVGTLLGDSLSLLDVAALTERAGAGWLDLGAGAGVPGLPLAVAVPGARVTLLEAASRKCTFLRAAVDAAGLGARCAVECARSERFAAAGAPGREAFGVVLARAVAPLPVLVELAAPMLRPGGVLLASKTGRDLAGEGPAAERAATLCGMAARPPQALPRSPLDDAVVALFEKTGTTPARLPRREGLAARRPLAR
jgi:16S rRNA (guanine527-N7)-methyltransferase